MREYERDKHVTTPSLPILQRQGLVQSQGEECHRPAGRHLPAQHEREQGEARCVGANIPQQTTLRRHAHLLGYAAIGPDVGPIR